jgi:hypothetical protein
LLDHPQTLELQGQVGAGQLGVGAQHPGAVVAGLVFDLRFIDREVARAFDLQEAPIAFVAARDSRR